MKVNTDGMRNFLQNYDSKSFSSESLNNLVIRYKETKDESVLATICQKSLGVISNHAKKLQNPDFTESDAYSHGMEVLLTAIDKWDPSKNTSFLTILYLYIHNKFDTLAYRSRNYRSYMHSRRSKVSKRYQENEDGEGSDLEISLDNLLDNYGESCYNLMPTITLENKDTSLEVGLFQDRPLSQKILDFIVKHNVIRKKDVADCLDISMKELNSEIRFIKKKAVERKLV